MTRVDLLRYLFPSFSRSFHPLVGVSGIHTSVSGQDGVMRTHILKMRPPPNSTRSNSGVTGVLDPQWRNNIAVLKRAAELSVTARQLLLSGSKAVSQSV